jgi:hypothetical protein
MQDVGQEDGELCHSLIIESRQIYGRHAAQHQGLSKNQKGAI